MIRSWFCALLMMGLTVCPALAAGFSGVTAKIEADRLVVVGRAAANQTVTLDGRYNTRSSVSGFFGFSLATYLPPDCIVDLKSGGSSGKAKIAGCAPGVDTQRRVVSKVCKADGEGWVEFGYVVYCIAACAEGETPLGGYYKRDYPDGYLEFGETRQRLYTVFQSPYPINRWFAFDLDDLGRIETRQTTVYSSCGRIR